MSNSSLVAYKKISPNKTSPRNHEIDTVTIHCVVGQVTAESLGDWFAKSSTQASSNYGVDKNGRIGMYVEEKDRSWCTSSGSNDHRAITIEVASDTKHPYAVTDAAYAGLIKLLVDICKRNPGIKKLRWKGDKSLIGQVSKQNMTVHRWFANKSCPGEYLYSRHDDIVAKVNALLEVDTEQPKTESVDAESVIWNFFKGKGLNDFAIAGIMGNLYAESALRSNNLQGGYEQKLNHTDASYTKAVDDGSYTNFVKDSAGYGLAQWTYYTRKQALLDYAKSVKKSIGDLNMQLDFMWKELQGYTSVMKVLKSATSVLEASNVILLQYERPADQSVSVQNKRAGYGQKYYDKFVEKKVAFKEGDIVKIVGTTYYNGKSVPSWVKAKTWVVKSATQTRVVVDKSTDNSSSIMSPFKPEALALVTSNKVQDTQAEKKVAYAQSRDDKLAGSYTVTATSGLNMRYTPGVLTDANVIVCLPKGAVVHNYGYFTAVNGTKWLYVAYKDKVGFIHSGYVKKS